MIYFKRVLLVFLSVVFLPLIVFFLLTANVYGTLLNPDFYDSQTVSVAYSNSSHIVFEKLKEDLPVVGNYMVPLEFEDMFASSFPQDAVLQSWQFFIKELRDANFKLTDGFGGINLDLLFIHEGFKNLAKDVSSTVVKRLPECAEAVTDPNAASEEDSAVCVKPTFSADFYRELYDKQISNSFIRLVPSSFKILELQPAANPGFFFNEFNFLRILTILGILVFVSLLLLIVLGMGNRKFALVYFGAYSIVIAFSLFVCRKLIMSYLPDISSGIKAFSQWQNVLSEVMDKSLQGLNLYLLVLLVVGFVLMGWGIYCKADRRTSIMA